MTRMYCILFLEIYLISGLLPEISWILISTSLFNILQYVILVDGYEELCLHICSWKREKNSNRFCRLVSTVLCYGAKTLQVSAISEFKTYQLIFILCDFKIHCFTFFYNGSFFTHAFFSMY